VSVTDLRSRRRWQPDCAALARSRVAAARSAAGLTPSEFAAMLTPLIGRTVTAGHVLSWESSATPPGDVVIAADTVSPSARLLGVRSHKFIAGYAGRAGTQFLGMHPGARAATYCGLDCLQVPVAHDDGPCMLTLWPSGSVIFHLCEDIEVPGVAALAEWRVRSYTENLEWAARFLREAGAGEQAASYVLSVYWVQRPIWAGRLLATGMRLLCAPRVLLDHGTTRSGGAEDAERALLADGYEHDGMRSFGMRGVSLGYASWSGVSYYPADESRALAEDDIVAVELALQSVWAMCEHVTECTERGESPGVPDGYGYKFLRAARSRLTTPRPQETGQHQAMRDALVETSGLPGILAQAIESLREDGTP
jgi:hypothetical protein